MCVYNILVYNCGFKLFRTETLVYFIVYLVDFQINQNEILWTSK